MANLQHANKDVATLTIEAPVIQDSTPSSQTNLEAGKKVFEDLGTSLRNLSNPLRQGVESMVGAARDFGLRVVGVTARLLAGEGAQVADETKEALGELSESIKESFGALKDNLRKNFSDLREEHVVQGSSKELRSVNNLIKRGVDDGTLTVEQAQAFSKKAAEINLSIVDKMIEKGAVDHLTRENRVAVERELKQEYKTLYREVVILRKAESYCQKLDGLLESKGALTPEEREKFAGDIKSLRGNASKLIQNVSEDAVITRGERKTVVAELKEKFQLVKDEIKSAALAGWVGGIAEGILEEFNKKKEAINKSAHEAVEKPIQLGKKNESAVSSKESVG